VTPRGLAAPAAARYTRAVPAARCPTCRRETSLADNPYRPFCSDRCRKIDLGAWFDERYRIPGAPLPADDADAAEDDE